MLTGRCIGDLEAVAESLARWDVSAVDEHTARTRMADSLVAGVSAAEAGNPPLSALLRPTSPDGYGRTLAARLRSSEIDDIVLRSCTTPGSVAVPAALASVLVAGDIAVDRLLAAVAAGYAVVDWCGLLLGGVEAIDRGQWPTRAAASIGAAATVAVALGLDEVACRHALALAAGSTWLGRPGEPARQLIFGTAVGYGVLAAQMAADGVQGDAAVLAQWVPDAGWVGESPLDPGPDVGSLSQDSLRLARIKPFCCAQQAMSSVIGLMDIVAEHDLAAEDVRSIDVWVPPACRRLIDRPVVQTRLDSIASLQYQLAAALYAPAHLWDVDRAALTMLERVSAVATMTHIHPDPELRDRYPGGWSARVVVATDQGDHIRLVRDDDPPEPDADLAAKINRLAAPDTARGDQLQEVVAACSEFASGAALLEQLSWRAFGSLRRKEDHAR